MTLREPKHRVHFPRRAENGRSTVDRFVLRTGNRRGLVWLSAILAVAVCTGLVAAPLPAKAAFPGHNGRIVFESVLDTNPPNFEIYSMNPDGSDPVDLTNTPELDAEPSWSPDGTRIAFESDRDDNREIYVMNADGSNPVRLTNDIAFDSDPTWSPDGALIAFRSQRTGTTRYTR